MNGSSFEITSLLAAPAADVWQHATSMPGIRFELSPWVSMTVPRGIDFDSLAGAAERVALPLAMGRSYILLFRLIPVDWDDLCIVELDHGRRFRENSTTLSLRRWSHERIIDPEGTGCRVTDRLGWEPRTLVPSRLVAPIVGTLFRHRHDRLRKRFGTIGSA